MKNILIKKEIKKFNKLLNKKDNIPVKRGNELLYILNIKTKKAYYPSVNMIID